MGFFIIFINKLIIVLIFNILNIKVKKTVNGKIAKGHGFYL